jgi:prolipoprotein diacylglyceryltransferase
MVAFYLPGGLPVYVFSLLLGLGASTGLAWISWQTPEKKAIQLLEAGLCTLLGSLLGGRAVFAAINWPYFRADPLAILRVSQGGLAWPGVLLGAAMALSIWTAVFHRSIATYAVALMPLAAALAVSAWLACWIDGCAYGHVSDAWWAMPSYDEWGLLTRRVPVQFLGALLTGGLFWFAERFRPLRWGDGLLALWVLLLLFIELFWLSTLRADPAPVWRGLRLDAWATLAGIFLAGSGLAIQYLMPKKKL